MSNKIFEKSDSIVITNEKSERHRLFSLPLHSFCNEEDISLFH